MFRRLLFIVPCAALAVGSTTACATKKFVRTSVSDVNDKVDSLGRSVEQTQERTRQNEGRIGEVDQKAQAANQAAVAAQSSADKANEAAMAAANSANTVNSRVDAVDKASKRLVFEVVLSEDEGNFTFGKHDLPEEAKAKLDQMISEGRLFRNRRAHRQHRHQGSERQAWARARRVGEEVSLRAAPDPAAQDERHQLRHGQADRAEQDQGRSRPEPPRRHQGAGLVGHLAIRFGD
jgi:chromosome segregation ATPase